MQSVTFSLLLLDFFQSESFHKNTDTFKEIYTKIKDVQDIDTETKQTLFSFSFAVNAVEVYCLPKV